jgi:hypothetical protein
LREAELQQNKKDSTKTNLGGFQEFHIHPSQGESAMNIAQIREALLWCVILNIGLVTVWSILVLVAKGMAELNHTEMVPGIGRTL